MNTLILIFYRIAAFFTRVPRKTKEKHAHIRAVKIADMASLDNSFINSQSKLSEIPYGCGNMGDNGCGPVAVYNALLSLKNAEKAEDKISDKDNVSLTDVIKDLEHRGATLHGKFGTSPAAIKKYLKKKGYSTKTCISKKPGKVNEFSENCDTFISIIYNNAESIGDGLHFICTEKTENGFKTHNPEHMSDSLFSALDMCSSNTIRHVYTIGILRH